MHLLDDHRKQKKALECYKTSRDKVHARNNKSKGHKDRRRGKAGVNEAGERQERQKERAMEGCC